MYYPSNEIYINEERVLFRRINLVAQTLDNGVRLLSAGSLFCLKDRYSYKKVSDLLILAYQGKKYLT